MTSSVADVVCVRVPSLPVKVSRSAQGTALVVVSIVKVDVPEPVIVEGLKPAGMTPLGHAEELLTERLTVRASPLRRVTATVKFAGCPGVTVTNDGLTEMLKSGLVGRTVIVRVGGLGSELPLASLTVSEAT